MTFTADEVEGGRKEDRHADMDFSIEEIQAGPKRPAQGDGHESARIGDGPPTGGAKDVAHPFKSGDHDHDHDHSAGGSTSPSSTDAKGDEFSDKSQDNGDPEEPDASDGKLTTGDNHKDDQYQALESGAPG